MRTAIRTVIAGLLLFPVFAYARTNAAIQAAESACGSADAHLRAEPVPQQAATLPAPDRATVYIMAFSFHVHPAYRIEAGVDGAWEALIGSSGHIAISLTSGPHHFCVRIANNLVDNKDRRIAVAGVDLEAGHTYYLVGSAGLNVPGEDGWPIIALRPVNDDEGRFLVVSTRAYGLKQAH